MMNAAAGHKFSLGRRLLFLIATPLIAAYIWMIRKTCRIELVLGEPYLKTAIERSEPVIPCGWHQSLVISAAYLLNQQREGLRLGYLISPSRDGELIARVVKLLGVEVMRGSSTRSGARAFRSIYRAVRQGISPMILADGPQGPARKFKTGAIMLARMTNAPVLPIGCAVDRYWQARSWDRMIIPKPFARIAVAMGKPRVIESQIDSDSLELAADDIGRRLDRLTAQAAAVLED